MSEGVALDKAVFCGARGAAPARGGADALRGDNVVATAVETGIPVRRHRDNHLEAI